MRAIFTEDDELHFKIEDVEGAPGGSWLEYTCNEGRPLSAVFADLVELINFFDDELAGLAKP